MANTAALAKLDEMEKGYVTMKNRMTALRGKAKVAVDHTTRSLEVIAGGALAGAAAGYFEDSEIFGFDAMLVVGIGGHVAAYALDDDTAKHVRNFADGSLAAYAALRTEKMVNDWANDKGGFAKRGRDKGGAGNGAKTTGDEPGGRGQRRMTPDEFSRAFGQG